MAVATYPSTPRAAHLARTSRERARELEPNMKHEIEAALQVLLGQPMWGSARAADMEMFAFGSRVSRTDALGRSREVGEYGLHVQCPWRITCSGRIIVGYGDVHDPRGELQDSSAFDPDVPGSTRRDERLELFFREAEHRVREVSASETGDIRLRFGNDCLLETFADSSTNGQGGSEYWRLLQPSGHFVVTARGIQRV